MVKTRDFTCNAEVQELIDAFEAGTIPPSQFDHVAHMAAALNYLEAQPLPEAVARMRQCLLQFTARHGVNVYHETITTFWMRLLHHLAGGPYRDLPLWSRINFIAKRWGNVGAIETHYSHAVINSKDARERWVPPDRLPLPF